MKRERRGQSGRQGRRVGSNYGRRRLAFQQLESRLTLDGSGALLGDPLSGSSETIDCQTPTDPETERVCSAAENELTTAATVENLDGSDPQADDELVLLEGTEGDAVALETDGAASETSGGDGQVAQEPLVDPLDPSLLEPIASDAVAPDTLAEEPLASEPLAEEPLASEPLVSEPLVSEPLVDGLLADEELMDELLADELLTDAAADDEPSESVWIDPTILGTAETSDLYEGTVIEKSDFELPATPPETSLIAAADSETP